MGFFATTDDTGVKWRSSPYLWLFFVLSVPLTMLTLGYWRWNLGHSVRLRAVKDAARWAV
jgi:hypothetical protein